MYTYILINRHNIYVYIYRYYIYICSCLYIYIYTVKEKQWPAIIDRTPAIVHVMEEEFWTVAGSVVGSTLRGKETKKVAFQPPTQGSERG